MGTAEVARRTSGSSAEPIDRHSLARAVHDLRAPLTVIRGLCEVIGRGDPPERVRNGLSAIEGEVARLADRLDSLADDARHGASQVDLARLAEDAVARFRWAGAERDVRISLRCATGSMVLGDPDRLARALDNLLANALRHCRPAGRVRVRVSRRAEWVHLRVADDGEGVPPADREVIFLPGQRGSAPRGRGQGLGLAIAREVALDHGGTLRLEATSAGAAFRLTLPATPGSAP